MNIRRDWSLGIDTCIWHLHLALAFGTCILDIFADLVSFFLLFAFCVLHYVYSRCQDLRLGSAWRMVYPVFLLYFGIALGGLIEDHLCTCCMFTKGILAWIYVSITF